MPILTDPLSRFIKIRIHIDSLEKKVKAANKKAANQKKILSWV